jgi:hypothetical protein
MLRRLRRWEPLSTAWVPGSGQREAGSAHDLPVCNPDECVEAGSLPVGTNVPYSGVVADEGMSVAIDWVGAYYDLPSCIQRSTENHWFTISRLTFGD